MGYDVQITRAEHWHDSERVPITADEWLRLVEQDADLMVDPRGNGPHFVLWIRHWVISDHPWFDWSAGKIYTKHPDRETLGKMLEIADFFGARVQGDDGEVYDSLADWP